MPYANCKKTFCTTINSSTQRKVRKLETNIINDTLNNDLLTSDILLSNEQPSTSKITEKNVSFVSMDNGNSDQNEIGANFSNDSDSEEINVISSSEEKNEFLSLFEEEFSNDDENDKDTENNDLKIFLANWAVKENISQTLRILLRGILQYTCEKCHYNIPSNPRTFLCTPRKTNVRNCADGEYYHFGLFKSIKDNLSLLKNLNNIKISINIDGLPLAKSSQQQLWPILGSVAHSKQVFIIGAYYGRKNLLIHKIF